MVLYQSNQAIYAVTSFQHYSEPFHFSGIPEQLKKGFQAMQHLTAQEVQRPHRFEKQQSRGSHTPLDDKGGKLLQQREVFSRKLWLSRRQSKRMNNFLS